MPHKRARRGWVQGYPANRLWHVPEPVMFLQWLPARDRWNFARTCQRAFLNVQKHKTYLARDHVYQPDKLRSVFTFDELKPKAEVDLKAWYKAVTRKYDQWHNSWEFYNAAVYIDQRQILFPPFHHMMFPRGALPPFDFDHMEGLNLLIIMLRSNCTPETLRLYLDAGWSPNVEYDGVSVLQVALTVRNVWTTVSTDVQCKNKDCVKLLVDRGAYWWKVRWHEYDIDTLIFFGKLVRPAKKLKCLFERLAVYLRTNWAELQYDPRLKELYEAWGWPSSELNGQFRVPFEI